LCLEFLLAGIRRAVTRSVIKRNYAAAKVPMLPVVRGDRETAR
jgi:hypothetical protein